MCTTSSCHYLPCACLTTPCSPGFKFSRASYLLSLLRPQIYAELELQVLLPSWHAGRASLLPVSILTPCLAAAWPEGAATGPLLLHPTAGGQEPTPLPADGA